MKYLVTTWKFIGFRDGQHSIENMRLVTGSKGVFAWLDQLDLHSIKDEAFRVYVLSATERPKNVTVKMHLSYQMSRKRRAV